MPDTTYNKEQQRAVCHYLGPAMILAGPGSGKTYTLVGRLCRLLKLGVDPASILVITYTKDAAFSMRQRFYKAMGGKTLPVVFGTFHAVFYQILKEHYRLGADSLLSERDKPLILFPLLKKFQISEDHMQEVLRCISLHKNGTVLDNPALPAGMKQEQFVSLFDAYEKCVESLGKLDFDDMLVKCRQLFLTHVDVLKKWQERFRFLMVDEFQDCNTVQYELIKLLAHPENNLYVVGDDDQAIYGFRGASPGIFTRFKADYPQAVQLSLEANYRSNAKIVEAAGRVIACNRERFHKALYAIQESTDSEAGVLINGFEDHKMAYGHLCKKLLALKNKLSFNEMAVITRTNAELEMLIPYLKAHGIPYIKGNMSKGMYDHFAVQDILAYLKLAMGKKERGTLFMVMNKPDRGLSRAGFLNDEVDWEESERLYAVCGQRESAVNIKRLKAQLMLAGHMSPGLAIQFVRKGMGYDQWLRQKAGEDTETLAEWDTILDRLKKEAEGYASISDWIKSIETVKLQKKAGDLLENGVRLLTLHASKGLEFTYVCILNVNEGTIPHGKLLTQTVLEEERRLFYVGMTRAKTALELLYLTGTKEHPRLPSSFLEPLWKFHSSSINSSNS